MRPLALLALLLQLCALLHTALARTHARSTRQSISKVLVYDTVGQRFIGYIGRKYSAQGFYDLTTNVSHAMAVAYTVPADGSPFALKHTHPHSARWPYLGSSARAHYGLASGADAAYLLGTPYTPPRAAPTGNISNSVMDSQTLFLAFVASSIWTRDARTNRLNITYQNRDGVVYPSLVYDKHAMRFELTTDPAGVIAQAGTSGLRQVDLALG